ESLGSALRGQRAGVRRAALDPLGQLRSPAELIRIHAEPSRHRPTAHDRDLRLRGGDEPVGGRGVDPHEDPALAARRDRHVAADQEGEAAEHLLLRYAGLPRDELTDPVGEILVVGHRAMLTKTGSYRNRAEA